ncbi:Rgp1-domain-containing protein [Xylogone sp. PMI_703]|nr:Rgp1-domain-containing protein [Xylogone sp. PMI_703]
MSTPSSNIRVFVQWKEQTVFAGENIDCEIIFKNVAPSATPSKTSLQPPAANGHISTTERQRKQSAATNKSISNASLRPVVPGRGHRATLSLSVSTAPGKQPTEAGSQNESRPKSSLGGTHKRSISIVSIGASESSVADVASRLGNPESPRRPRGHARSASLQIVPRRTGVNGGPPSATMSQRPPVQPSPLFVSSFPPGPIHSRRQSAAGTVPSSPGAGRALPDRRRGSAFSPNFKFPLSTSPSPDKPSDQANADGIPPHVQDANRALSPLPRENIPIIAGQVGTSSPAARVISPVSIAGTPRSSGEFYSLSNNSTETLASEYVPQTARLITQVNHMRRPSNLSAVYSPRQTETLMMGYAQLHGSFTLDGSLISQAPFEEVKRKGAVGGQGGGVIGLETSKRPGSLLRGFGWSNIGESLGGFLGGNELSSIKDMRGIANSKSIPLLATPQSILFVDLRLSPGESRRYKYSFRLPRGLPPSHRGRVIKISYKLVVGIQRSGGAKEQQVRSVEIPFRVLGSVNSYGELLGHDLMSPYIILRDQAEVQSLDTPSSAISEHPKKIDSKAKASTLNDFLAYVDELIASPSQNSSLGLLSPTEARSRRHSAIEEPINAKEAIDLAILRSNMANESRQSANRFEIARGGKRVAVVMLARPSYRLGETITAAIDFTDADIPCYAIHSSLETSERIDAAIALRSESSILRATRKTHVSHSESTLFARRVVFAPTIPISATPEFITSGVSLDWRIRIEFVTPRLAHSEDEVNKVAADLLEEVSRDDRGSIFVAAEGLDCESFEIAVPLRVYGALGGNPDRDESAFDGLIV